MISVYEINLPQQIDVLFRFYVRSVCSSFEFHFQVCFVKLGFDLDHIVSAVLQTWWKTNFFNFYNSIQISMFKPLTMLRVWQFHGFAAVRVGLKMIHHCAESFAWYQCRASNSPYTAIACSPLPKPVFKWINCNESFNYVNILWIWITLKPFSFSSFACLNDLYLVAISLLSLLRKNCMNSSPPSKRFSWNFFGRRKTLC